MTNAASATKLFDPDVWEGEAAVAPVRRLDHRGIPESAPVGVRPAEIDDILLQYAGWLAYDS